MKKAIKFLYVYLITNTVLNKQYVGSKVCYKDDLLNDGYWGSSKALNDDYITYGKNKFTKEILQYDYKSKEDMLNGESYYIIKYNTLSPNGYNRFIPNTNLGFHMSGYKHTKETKIKMSLKRKGVKKTKETKEKMSKSQIGRFVSEESKDKNRKSNTGKKRSDEFRHKMHIVRKGKNPFNKNLMATWIEKYGEEAALQKESSRKMKERETKNKKREAVVNLS